MFCSQAVGPELELGTRLIPASFFNTSSGRDALSSLIRSTLPFLTGLALVAAGTLLRLTCYRCLGPLFTFDLTLFPKHTLITSGPYSIVRHPADLGSLLVFLGQNAVVLKDCWRHCRL